MSVYVRFFLRECVLGCGSECVSKRVSKRVILMLLELIEPVSN